MNKLVNINGVQVADIIEGKTAISSLDVAKMVGREHKHVIRDLRNIIKKLESNDLIVTEDYYIKSTYQNTRNQTQPKFYLTYKGCDLYCKRMTGISQIKMVDFMNKTLVVTKPITVLMPDSKEKTFFESLEKVLASFSLTLIKEHKMSKNKYSIDGYIPEINLAIEYDEEFHKNQQEEDNKRQLEIQKQYGYNFVRLDANNSHEENIGKVTLLIAYYLSNPEKNIEIGEKEYSDIEHNISGCHDTGAVIYGDYCLTPSYRIEDLNMRKAYWKNEQLHTQKLQEQVYMLAELLALHDGTFDGMEHDSKNDN